MSATITMTATFSIRLMSASRGSLSRPRAAATSLDFSAAPKSPVAAGRPRGWRTGESRLAAPSRSHRECRSYCHSADGHTHTSVDARMLQTPEIRGPRTIADVRGHEEAHSSTAGRQFESGRRLSHLRGFPPGASPRGGRLTTVLTTAGWRAGLLLAVCRPDSRSRRSRRGRSPVGPESKPGLRVLAGKIIEGLEDLADIADGVA